MAAGTLRAGVIGLGMISGTHIDQYEKAAGVELVAAADVNADALGTAVEAHGFAGYADWRAMLDEAKLDVVSVCTPPFLHKEMVLEAMGRGIHVMCEKPIAATTEDAEAIAAAVGELDAKLMIAYCHRWQPTIRKVKEILDAGVIGRPLFYRCTFAGWIDFAGNHRGSKREAGGGALMDNGSHAADIYQSLMGKIANVSCRAGTFVQDIETEDVALMIFEGDNGCYGEVLVGYSVQSQIEFKIIGEDGVISIDDYFAGPVRVQAKGAGEWTDHVVEPGDRFDGEFANFLGAVRGEEDLESTAETALHIHRVIAAAYEDAASGGVRVP